MDQSRLGSMINWRQGFGDTKVKVLTASHNLIEVEVSVANEIHVIEGSRVEGTLDISHVSFEVEVAFQVWGVVRHLGNGNGCWFIETCDRWSGCLCWVWCVFCGVKVASSVGRAMVLKGGRDPVFLFVEEQSCFRAERVLRGILGEIGWKLLHTLCARCCVSVGLIG